eukprot:CAMPEP_0116985776 /NCGR_PEP_ID=MMETSP0467-20121206/62464_1 /TAXON_ID=283647 /ORGANISM="Mesodinium pulex, Strain SPMC105" /LENGTH=56 /DNA_ID=CAMNT_0004681173 /DNA_START=1 /DNA_END=168 /DNA_ORIENTATION=+
MDFTVLDVRLKDELELSSFPEYNQHNVKVDLVHIPLHELKTWQTHACWALDKNKPI